jgi:hypothetical protein
MMVSTASVLSKHESKTNHLTLWHVNPGIRVIDVCKRPKTIFCHLISSMDRPKRLLISLALLTVFLSCLSSTGAECVLAVDGVEGFFDLSSLQGKIYTAQTPVGGYTYQFAVCGVVMECTSLPNAAVCQSWDGGKANCGVWNSSAVQTFPLPASSQSTGIGLVVRNGDEVLPLLTISRMF